MENQPLLTTEGAERLRRELERLERVERKEISEAIASARAHGDLSENAEYHAAREKQGMMEARIRLLRHSLGQAKQVDVSLVKTDGTVRFGCQVQLVRLDNEQELSLQIVGELESDPGAGRISLSAPVARALLDKKEGDVAAVQTPDGVLEYEILSVSVGSTP